jgi:hypothetical protein
VNSVDHLVEGRGGATLLLESDKAQIGLAAMLKYSIELGDELDLPEAENYVIVSIESS